MSTKRIAYIAVFTALITIGGLVSVPIPFTQVRLSFQTVFVILAGLLLGVDGVISVVIYIFMGLCGLPVFTQGGGLAYVFMPSFGYLIGFTLGALVSGVLCKRLSERTRGHVFLCALVGLIPVYAIGVTYQVLILYYYMGSAWGAVIGGLPALGVLLLKDAVLCGLVATLYPSIVRATKLNRSRPARLKNHGQNI